MKTTPARLLLSSALLLSQCCSPLFAQVSGGQGITNYNFGSDPAPTTTLPVSQPLENPPASSGEPPKPAFLAQPPKSEPAAPALKKEVSVQATVRKPFKLYGRIDQI